MNKSKTSVLGDLDIARRALDNVNARLRKLDAERQRTAQEQRNASKAYDAARKAVTEAYPEI